MSKKSIAVVITVKNDAEGIDLTLQSLRNQTRRPDEIILVDGGSTDETAASIWQYVKGDPRVLFIEAPGANIARGRNIGIKAAHGEIIVTTDAGCRLEPTWLECLVRPFENDGDIDFVAGFYRIEPRSLLEHVVGLSTMRGQLDPIDPESFNPSARSMAFTKELWRRTDGFPDWLVFSEDTLFDLKVRRMGVSWRFAEDAVVRWRPRSSLGAIARQFFHYGTGRGHTQIGAVDFAYNLRSMILTTGAAVACLLSTYALPVLLVLLAYFYVWTFHRKALRIMRRTGRVAAYPLCMIVLWTVLVANTSGYVLGSWQRWRNRPLYRRNQEAYLRPEL